METAKLVWYISEMQVFLARPETIDQLAIICPRLGSGLKSGPLEINADTDIATFQCRHCGDRHEVKLGVVTQMVRVSHF